MSSVAEENKQEKLNQETAKAVQSSGGINYLYAEYIRKVANRVVQSEDSVVDRLQPNVHVDIKEEAWRQAICVTLAYLKRFKMEESIATMRTEFPETPAKSGYSKRSDLEAFFSETADIISEVKRKNFDKRVKAFADEAGLDAAMPSAKKEKRHKH
ncbi:hypothetical protein TVAG_257010 [Trichomonas vaginalis G3]|uniref:Uncharacterized protein n=1 Tax=Trichomonas vaginalis (strain ATCC PRA-98 / G3) TaxID=412133 RepID=A2FZQ1_TRIV3|nr:hypothetical protein TVAGG3_0555410 [Trichomonas vaginalis G3]EAX89621.1 hypothetical protein TVAG_257010 [Trichomonas vaginalis G3]KAI5520813.1 hypothetical protein TVAGG3_0555410 [Trichomonas vaginalis G3]|eukprot:XP_001302551.1 hypothetical protein [Trichomonas vaginalis G3]